LSTKIEVTQTDLENKIYVVTATNSEAIYARISELGKKVEAYKYEVQQNFQSVSQLFILNQRSEKLLKQNLLNMNIKESAFQTEITSLKAEVERLKYVDQSNIEHERMSQLVQDSFVNYKKLLEPIYAFSEGKAE